MGGVGALSWRLWVLPPRLDAARLESAWTRIRQVLLLAVLGLTLTTPVLLLVRAADMGRQTLLGALPLLPRVLAASHYGTVWQVRAGAVVVLWVGLWTIWEGAGKGSAALMAVAMLAIAWSYSAAGHAAAFGDFSLVQIVDWVHIASTTIWMGGLLVLATAARPLLLGENLTGCDRDRGVEAAERLSRLAGFALAGVVLTGTYNAVTQIADPSALWESAYGRLLLFKLAGVIGMAGLGAINRYRGLPGLRDWARGGPYRPRERFLRIATVESLLAVWILGCTALLTGTTPPREAHDAHHAATPTPSANHDGATGEPAG